MTATSRVPAPAGCAGKSFPGTARYEPEYLALTTSVSADAVPSLARRRSASACTIKIGCRSEIDQLGGTSVLRFDNVIWN